MIWNISKSIEQGVTVFDTIVTVENGPGLGNYSYVYSLPNHEYIGCLPAMYTTIELDKATVPTLERRDLYSNELIASYNPFKEAFVKENDKVIGVERYFSAGSCVKPDGSKIAQSMIYLDQINIIDVESGEIRGFRVEGSPDFSVFRKAPDIKWYHFDIQCDDRYIYSLYSGEKYESDQKKVVLPHLVHVYDWEGNFVRKLDLGQGVARIWIDPANTNLLYTMNYNTETLCRYDLNQMQ